MHQAFARTINHGINVMSMAAAMPLAVMVTLAHRLPMLADTMAGSGSWANPEFRRMTSEKTTAGFSASSHMMDALLAGQRAAARFAFDQASANLALMTVPPLSPAQVFAFANASFARLATLSIGLGEAGSRALDHGLQPAHRKVTANARRLSARRQRR